jgi:hypothetical protein
MAKAAKCSVIRSWGTPDPRDANAYPKADAPMPTFAWQFLRRRDDYRRRWTQLQKAVADRGDWWAVEVSQKDGSICRQSAEDALHDEFRVNSTAANGLVDPRLDAPPLFDGAEVVIEIEMQTALVKLPKVLIQFDLTLPIEPQLEGARWLLRRKARKSGGAPWPNVKPRSGQLSLYLRLLDFHEEGAPEEEIGSTLYPNLSGEQLHDTVRKNFDAALKCQDNYLHLALRSRA